MTWEEAKDQIAKKYGYKTWQSINFYELDENLSILEAGFDSSTLIDEAAQLYAREVADKAWEASKSYSLCTPGYTDLPNKEDFMKQLFPESSESKPNRSET